jgi:5-methylcytosine-specific restriction endonuclease McrA
VRSPGAKYNERAVICGAIRRAFARSPVKKAVMLAGRREVPKFNKDGARAKRDGVEYQCQCCNKWKPSTGFDVDHISPVIDPVIGFVDWNTFVARVHCGPENLQRICEPCHKEKCKAENLARNMKRWERELLEAAPQDYLTARKTLRRLAKCPGVGDRAAAMFAQKKAEALCLRLTGASEGATKAS